MLILAIDTSGRKGSVAVCRGDADSFEAVQLTPLEGGTYSARLMPTISSLLEQNRLGKENIDGFAVVSGPGSFTGLRVGLATVKGLCEILHKPLATVSMLEAVAMTHGRAGRVTTAILDAGRGEIYVAEYQVASDGASLRREYIAKLADFAMVPSRLEEDLLTPDAAVADFLEARSFKIRRVTAVQADEIGRIAIRKLLAGNLADPAGVDANYIRRSDAEIFSAPKG